MQKCGETIDCVWSYGSVLFLFCFVFSNSAKQKLKKRKRLKQKQEVKENLEKQTHMQ